MAIDTTKKIKQVTYNGTEIPLRGYDTSDATVTAGDIVSPKTAYGASGKVNGTMANYKSGTFILDNTRVSVGGSKLYIKGDPPRAMAIDMNTTVQASTALSNLGNATAADVAKGKTFTSATGLKVTGTAEGSSAADVTFELYNNDFDALTVVYMANGTITEVTIPLSDHKGITTPEGSIVALIDRFFKGDTIDLVPTSGSITQGWRDANITLFVAGAETNGMNIDVNMT